jgi:hypothetical protein
MGKNKPDLEGDKWWEISLAWKWPHEGFTVGYDLIEPIEEDEMKYCSFILYLGPVSIIINWGNHSWNE